MSPPTEAVEEFKLQTDTLGAEYGGGQTAVANFVVKSGTNEFHGSGAIYVQDSSMDARPFVAKALGQSPPARELRNWALALGGPVTLPKIYSGRDRSFFFVTYETTHNEEQNSTAFRTLPTREFQNGDFSRLFDAGYTGDARSGTIVGTDALGRPVRFGQIYDPRSTRVANGIVVRDPFPNNVVPREVWDAVARNTIEMGLWDAPALDRLLNNQLVLGNCCPVFDQKTLAMKFDQMLTSNHRASFYVNREWRTRNNSLGGRYGAPPGSPTNLYQLQDTPSWMIRASENWVIGSRLLHRFAFGYNRFENRNRSVYCNQGWPSRIGLANQPDTTFPRFAFGGTAILGNLGNFGSISRGLSYEGSAIVQDDLTIIMGRHSVKTGFEGRFYFVDNENADGTASYNFASAQTNLPGFDQTTGHTYASLLVGAVATSSRPVQAVNTDYYQRDFAFYGCCGTTVMAPSAMRRRQQASRSTPGKALGVAMHDYDRDGWIDLFVANDSVAQFLFRNTGGGAFVETALAAGVAYDDDGRSFAGMGTDIEDYDGDGWPDVIVTTLSLERYALYQATGQGRFAYASHVSGVTAATLQHSGWGTKFIDFDNDGQRDLFVAQSHVLDTVTRARQGFDYLQPPLMLRNTGAVFADVSASLGPAFRTARRRPGRRLRRSR